MRKRIQKLLAATILVFIFTAAHTALLAAETEVKIVCFGDSITKRGFPAELAKILDVEVIAAGVAGNSSVEGLIRMQTDVLDHKPTHVVILFGTNDNRIDAPHKYQSPKQYAQNLREMIERCQAIGAKVIICTIPPINTETYFTRHETTEYNKAGGLNKMLKQTRKAAIKVAKQHKLPIVDLNQKLLKTPEWMHKDGVHPSPAGNRIIAELVAEKLIPQRENK